LIENIAGLSSVARESGIEPVRGELGRNALAWVAGVVMVYSIMFATGSLIFHNTRHLIYFSIALVVSAIVVMRVMFTERLLDN